MKGRVSNFYQNQHIIIKEIFSYIDDIVLLLKKQREEIEIRQLRKSLKNNFDNYGNK
jgi:hypothetical protein